ncbi:TRAP transporter substrate-binding protein [Mesobacillus foraminis]|uniref:TRAP transporter substrate-binding protein n=1 Tax=Mesobacillus foraminis TaxID=279826 RepID=UPI001BE52259|nr:TRAP transporter substrate-binding protein [Mesobacillus foraminis]MBT2756822.1 TRAP transporter substrate-binding protein [Mesobacillus foraminis]
MKGKKTLWTLLSLILLLGVASGCSSTSKASAGNSEKSFEFIISSNQPNTHPTVMALKEFAKEIEEQSQGTMKAEVYSSGVLGSDRETLELVQFGAIDMVSTGVSTIESYDKMYSLFSVPYLFNDKSHYYKMMDSEYMKEEIFPITAESGFVVKTWFDAGARSFYTQDTPISEPSDLKGLKMRTLASPTLMEMVSLMGGNPTPLDWGEVYGALQQGVIDGLENNELALTVNKHAEVAKEFSNTRHLFAPDVLIVNSQTLNKLTNNQKEILDNAFHELSINQRELWADATEKAIREAKEQGVNFTEPNVQAFIDTVKPMHERVAKEYPEFIETVTRLGEKNK